MGNDVEQFGRLFRAFRHCHLLHWTLYSYTFQINNNDNNLGGYRIYTSTVFQFIICWFLELANKQVLQNTHLNNVCNTGGVMIPLLLLLL